jgi:hypothetical protein
VHKERAVTPMLAPLTAVCLTAAAHAYQIPEHYLYGILAVEGGRVGESIEDANGTRDLGPFQVNSTWGSAIAQYWHVPHDRALDRVRDDGCANAIVATAILRSYANEARGDIPMAIGLYHSHSPRLAKQYRAKVVSALESMTSSR